jgi:uncharacterized protein (DUF2267 family)
VVDYERYEFVSRVALREGVSLDDAREPANAVLRTLREAVPSEELVDVTAQLPREFDELLSPRATHRVGP